MSSSPDTGPGLTPAGRRLIKRCAELGIAVDLSHLTEGGFWDVAHELEAPLIASHSCAYALVPASRRWPLAELIAACRTYSAQTGRRIFFEWTLIAGQNDSPAQAARLAALLSGLAAHVNLIPLNPTGGFSGAPSAAAAGLAFQRTLRAAGLPCTFRQRRGLDVAAGCGQLRTEKTRTGR